MLKRNTLFSALLLSLLCSPGSARTLQQVLNDGTLRVGVAIYTPWAMRDASGELSGFEIDVATKLAEDMQVEVEFTVYSWERIILALESGEIDAYPEYSGTISQVIFEMAGDPGERCPPGK